MSNDEIAALLAQPKGTVEPLEFEDRTNHAGHQSAVAVLTDAEGATLPGLTIQLEVKASATTDRCLYFFSIMLRHGQTRHRIYQLEVCPSNKRSHNGPGLVLYGPHEHVGDLVPTAVQDPDVRCGEWSNGWRWFRGRCNLAAEIRTIPC